MAGRCSWSGDRLRGGAVGRLRARPLTGGRWPSRSRATTHDAGILAESVAPAPIDPIIANDAREIADSVARGLDLVGVLTVELFRSGAAG